MNVFSSAGEVADEVCERKVRMNTRSAARQVADAVRERIAEGDLRPNARLLCQAELAQTHAVSGRVIAQAIRILRDDGLIRTVPGKIRTVPGKASCVRPAEGGVTR